MNNEFYYQNLALKIIEITLNHFSLSVHEFFMNKQKERYVYVRQITHYLIRKNVGKNMTLAQIGELAGKKTSDGVHYSIAVIEKEFIHTPRVRNLIHLLQKSIDPYLKTS